MRYQFHVCQTEIKFSTGTLDKAKVHSAMLKKATRQKIAKRDLLTLANVTSLRRCAFCDKEILHFHYIFNLIEFREMTYELIITDIQYLSELYCCYEKGCPAKHLNANSVAFVSKAYGMTEEQALSFIRSRNSSPFYRENHESDESYRDYQNVFKRLSSTHNLPAIIDRQNHSRSLIGYQERFGKIEGQTRWKIVQSQKAITLENYLRQGLTEDVAHEKHKNWRSTISQSLPNCIRRHGNVEGRIAYRKFVERWSQAGGNAKRIEHDGKMFYSSWEVDFYKKLKAITPVIPFVFDMRYPESHLRSDFYFPIIDRHLEICGQFFRDGYRERIELKKSMFNCIIVEHPSNFDDIIAHIIELHEKHNEH